MRVKFKHRLGDIVRAEVWEKVGKVSAIHANLLPTGSVGLSYSIKFHGYMQSHLFAERLVHKANKIEREAYEAVAKSKQGGPDGK